MDHQGPLNRAKARVAAAIAETRESERIIRAARKRISEATASTIVDPMFEEG